MLVKQTHILKKKLSRNDLGKQGHQGGIYVPKGWVKFFPAPGLKGDKCPVKFIVPEGKEYIFQWKYYKSKAKNEYHLTHMVSFFRDTGAEVGDTIFIGIPSDPGAPYTIWCESSAKGMDDDPPSLENISSTREGQIKIRRVRMFERDPANRKRAIEIHGCRCLACEVLLEEVYGKPAANFIHFHHTVPLSQMGYDYVFDVERDLIPLCPNCHAIAHIRGHSYPPYSLEEIRKMIKGQKSP